MDKIDRLLDAMEHPERFTPTEIEDMLKDPEVKEFFDLLDKTKSSLQTVVTPDIDEEWSRFENKHSKSASSLMDWLARVFTRNAAASIAIVIATFTAVATIVGVGIHHINTDRKASIHEVRAVDDKDAVASQPNLLEASEVEGKAAPETVVFDDEPLETILTYIAAYYDCKVVFNNEASKSLRLYFRWNQGLPLEEVVERLNNFEQINLTVKDKTIKAD